MEGAALVGTEKTVEETGLVGMGQWMKGAVLVGTSGLVCMGQLMEGAVLVGTAGLVCMWQEPRWYTHISGA